MSTPLTALAFGQKSHIIGPEHPEDLKPPMLTKDFPGLERELNKGSKKPHLAQLLDLLA